MSKEVCLYFVYNLSGDAALKNSEPTFFFQDRELTKGPRKDKTHFFLNTFQHYNPITQSIKVATTLR